MNLMELYESLPPASYDGKWMTEDANIAFLISLGAGPWGVKRRTKVQLDAVNWFYSNHYKDLLYARLEKIYPLDWQNNFLLSMIARLKVWGRTFHSHCYIWKKKYSWDQSLKQLFEYCGTSPAGAKVLWMFARDYLGLPSFPIDRHVKRFLKANNLPVDSWQITYLCRSLQIDPGDFNRRIFDSRAKNGSMDENLLKQGGLNV